MDNLGKIKINSRRRPSGSRKPRIPRAYTQWLPVESLGRD